MVIGYRGFKGSSIWGGVSRNLNRRGVYSWCDEACIQRNPFTRGFLGVRDGSVVSTVAAYFRLSLKVYRYSGERLPLNISRWNCWTLLPLLVKLLNIPPHSQWLSALNWPGYVYGQLCIIAHKVNSVCSQKDFVSGLGVTLGRWPVSNGACGPPLLRLDYSLTRVRACFDRVHIIMQIGLAYKNTIVLCIFLFRNSNS